MDRRSNEIINRIAEVVSMIKEKPNSFEYSFDFVEHAMNHVSKLRVFESLLEYLVEAHSRIKDRVLLSQVLSGFIQCGMFSERVFNHYINAKRQLISDIGQRHFETHHLKVILSDLESWLSIAIETLNMN